MYLHRGETMGGSLLTTCLTQRHSEDAAGTMIKNKITVMSIFTPTNVNDVFITNRCFVHFN